MMRLLLIFCLCGLVFTQEPVSDDVAVEEVAVDDDFDVGRALEELLVDETDVVDDMDIIDGEKAIAAPTLSSDAAQVTPEVTEQFNRLTDVIISKVNVALRTKKLDPLSLNFQKNKKSKRKNKNAKKNSRKRQRKRKRNRSRKNKNKKNRKARDLNEMDEEDETMMEAEEDEEEEEEVATYIAEEEVDEAQQDEEDEEEDEDEVERVRRDAEEEEVDEEEGEEGEGGRKMGKRKKGAPKRKPGAKKPKGKGKPKGKKGGKKGKKKRKSRKRRSAAIVGVLSGLSSLKRSGDVVVQGEPGNSDIVADFTAGPVNLVAIRKLGKGKKQRRSKATVNMLRGRMVIRFSEGSSQISDIILYKPDDIDIDGALSKGKKKQTDAQMLKKVRQVNPIVATKLKQVTRDVLQTIRIQ